MADVKARATLDSSGFQAGVGKMKGEVKGFSSQLGSMKGLIAGAFSVGAIIGFTRSVADLGDEIYHNALQTRTSIEGYQALVRIWEHAYGNASGLVKVLSKLSTAQARAGREKSMQKAFDDLGLSIQEIKGLGVEDLLTKIADKFEENGKTVAWASGIYRIFGDKHARVLNETLNELADGGLKRVQEEMKRTGAIMTTETAVMLADAKDRWSDFWDTTKKMAAESFNWLVDAGTTEAAMIGIAFEKGLSEKTLAGAFKGLIEGWKAARFFLKKEKELAVKEFNDRVKAEQDMAKQMADLTAGEKGDDGKKPDADKEDGEARKKAEKEAVELLKAQLGYEGKVAKYAYEKMTTQEKLLDQRRELADIESDLGAIKNEKEQLKLLSQRIDILKNIEKIEKDINIQDEEMARLRKEDAASVEGAQKEMARLRKEDAASVEGAQKELVDIRGGAGQMVGQVMADRLARIGGTLGGQASPQMRVAERELQILKEMRDFEKRLPRELANELRELGVLT